MAISEQNVIALSAQRGEPTWFTEQRLSALSEFDAMSLPREREEAWRYTNVEKFDILSFLGNEQKFNVVLNGVNDMKDVIFCTLTDALQRHPDLVQRSFLRVYDDYPFISRDKFSLLHHALITDGVFLYVPKNTTINLATSLLAHGTAFSHSIIVLEPGSTVNYFEEYLATRSKAQLHAGTVELYVGEGASLNFHTLHNLVACYDFSNKVATLGKDAQLRWLLCTAGEKLARVKIDTVFAGEGAAAETFCAFTGRQTNHVDVTTNAFHVVPRTRGNIIAKGVLYDASTSVYRGMIKIWKGAQQTDSYLSDHTLKMSETSIANSIPALEIDANDVKASHGVTVGQVDEEQLFYLMSRGLPRQDAEQLIVDGFFDPLLAHVPVLNIRDRFKKHLVE